MIKYFFNFLLFILLSSLYSCSPTSILASGGATTLVVAEGDRSLGTVVDDATIKLNISTKLLKAGKSLFVNINTNVLEGRVLLTGVVDNQEIRIEAIRSIWEVNGVKEVINEIQVGDKTTIKEYAQDLWINTQVKALAAKNIGLKSLSFNFETIRGRVYIAGLTSKSEQVDLIIQSTKTIKGVKEIINYVIIK